MVDSNSSAESRSREQNDSALSRWSRRKQDARHQASQEPVESTDAQTTNDIAVGLKGDLQVEREEQLQTDQTSATLSENEEPLLTDDDMPAIESLDSSSNLSCFFNAGVSENLRQAALRHLLRLPAFNITDGLNDYDEDYTSFEPLGDIVTSDMRFHERRKAKLAEQEKLEEQRLAEQSTEDAATDELELNTEADQAEIDEDEANIDDEQGTEIADIDPEDYAENIPALKDDNESVYVGALDGKSDFGETQPVVQLDLPTRKDLS